MFALRSWLLVWVMVAIICILLVRGWSIVFELIIITVLSHLPLLRIIKIPELLLLSVILVFLLMLLMLLPTVKSVLTFLIRIILSAWFVIFYISKSFFSLVLRYICVVLVAGNIIVFHLFSLAFRKFSARKICWLIFLVVFYLMILLLCFLMTVISSLHLWIAGLIIVTLWSLW